MYWPSVGLLMVGPNEKWIRYTVEEAGLYLLPDPDGLRIFTPTKCEFLQKVPRTHPLLDQPEESQRLKVVDCPLLLTQSVACLDSTAVVEDVFAIGSKAASALLYDAITHYKKGSPRAYENVKCATPLPILIPYSLSAYSDIIILLLHQDDQDRAD